jgi:CheY-like chemotaxis protein
MGTSGHCVLQVEDEESDVILFRHACTQMGFTHAIQLARDGQEALDYLAGTGVFANRAEYPLPALVLLDLKLPQVDGFDVLRWIRAQPEFTSLKVVVFSSSNHHEDIERAYQLGANSYLVKPLTNAERLAIVTRLEFMVSDAAAARSATPILAERRLSHASGPGERRISS